MPDTTKLEPLPITDPDNVPVTFINDVAASGYLNGVINLTFVTAKWTPTSSADNAITADLVISSRLRMDMYCAKRLHEQLDQFLKTASASTGGQSN